MADDTDTLRESIDIARQIAASIRLRHDRGHPTEPDTRKAATLLLTLADELERARPELKPEVDDA